MFGDIAVFGNGTQSLEETVASAPTVQTDSAWETLIKSNPVAKCQSFDFEASLRDFCGLLRSFLVQLQDFMGVWLRTCTQT